MICNYKHNRRLRNQLTELSHNDDLGSARDLAFLLVLRNSGTDVKPAKFTQIQQMTVDPGASFNNFLRGWDTGSAVDQWILRAGLLPGDALWWSMSRWGNRRQPLTLRGMRYLANSYGWTTE